MDEVQLSALAAQLRMPHGESAAEVGETMNRGNAYINHYTIEELDPKGDEHILEIGMGNGFFVKDILERDADIRYIGCDHSEDMIEQASRRNERFIENGQAKFFHGSGSELPFGGETFDKVFTINTIYFWEDPDAMLGEFHRVMKWNGKLLVALRPESVMKTYPFVKYGFKVFSREQVCELLIGNGFRVENIVERSEPAQELNGEILQMETLILSAVKTEPGMD